MSTNTKILTDVKMPFCPGCGHTTATRSISKALEELGYSTYDVSIVSDIGCSGLVDPLFATHTIHGLHGRSPALGLGVALGMKNDKKKTIVIQGDGGATIGLQHVMEAARRNVDMTLVIFNNMLFGMTGGQMSGFSTNEFKDYKISSDNADPYDIVKLAHTAGASLAVRVNDMRQFTDVLKEAIETKGFSLVEMSSLCTSYAMKKVSDLQEYTIEEERYTNVRPVGVSLDRKTKPLWDVTKGLETKYTHHIVGRKGILIAGSAGGGVQSSAKLLAQAGIISGLHATMKGEYPITVGTGFSVAEVILSNNTINYTGLQKPDIAIVVSEDGWEKIKNRITPETIIIADDKLAIEGENVTLLPFSKVSGKKSAAMTAIAYCMLAHKRISIDSFKDVVSKHKYADILLPAIENVDKILEKLSDKEMV